MTGPLPTQHSADHRLQRNQTSRAQVAVNSGRTQKLVLMGDRRSGKSSVAGVVFHKESPFDTLYAESTTEVTPAGMRSFMNFHTLELPGYFDYASQSDVFQDKGSIIWILDSQVEYLETLSRINELLLFLQQKHPRISVAIFVHKVDGLSEDYRDEVYQDVRQKVLDELEDQGYFNPPVSFHTTSIFDHSIFEAVSSVVQKLMPQLSTLESLLNSLCSTCKIQKAYLFDTPSKIYIASDTSPPDDTNYGVCSDFIDVVVDITEIYGWDRSTAPDYDEPEPIDYNNEATESLVSMERRGSPYLYLREIDQFLALVCIMSEDNPMHRKAIVDYNVNIFKDALMKIW